MQKFPGKKGEYSPEKIVTCTSDVQGCKDQGKGRQELDKHME